MTRRFLVVPSAYSPRRWSVWWRGATAVVLLAGALALPGSAAAAGFTATLSAPTHTPAVGKEQITVTATRGTQKLSGSVNYEFLYSGQVVSHQAGHSFTGGVFHDTLIWPLDSVGYPLTLRVIVQTRYGTDDIDYWIKVKL